MKKVELKTMIREIVREEVKMELRSYLKEYKLNKSKNTKKSKVKRPIIKKPVEKVEQNYSSNPLLNDILNETANSGDWATLGDEPFTTNNMSDILSKSYELTGGDSTLEQTSVPTGVDPSAIPEYLTKALTKDYSGLMKTINKKKGTV